MLKDYMINLVHQCSSKATLNLTEATAICKQSFAKSILIFL